MKSESIVEAAIVIALILGGVWIYNTMFKHDTWTLTYISPINGSSSTIGQYDTRGECQYKLNLAKQYPSKYSRPECGKNCEPSGIFDGYICDETFEL